MIKSGRAKCEVVRKQGSKIRLSDINVTAGAAEGLGNFPRGDLII